MNDEWKKTRFEPFPGLCVWSDYSEFWYKIVKIEGENVYTERYDKYGKPFWVFEIKLYLLWDDKNHYVILENELWPGEPGCPELPNSLRYEVKADSYVWKFNGVSWGKVHTVVKITNACFSIPVLLTKCNYNTTCPLCGSPAEILFKLTCSNSNCINY